jgi:predicted peptidase
MNIWHGWTAVGCAVLVVVCATRVTRGDEVKDRYEAKTWKAADGYYKDHDFNYRLLKPAKVEAGQKYPLVIFLHGAGERGSDNANQLKYFPQWISEPANREKYPAYVLAPQCPADRIWGTMHWGSGKTGFDDKPSDEMTATLAVMAQLIKDEAVDPDRVYITGLSMGGFGTWEFATRRPELFAAAAPVCGGGDKNNVKPLVGLPLWAWHGDADGAVNVERSREMIAAIKAAGGSPKYTELPKVGHDSWNQAYNGPDNMLPWLFSQSRKDKK